MDDNDIIFGDITQTPGAAGWENDPNREFTEASYLDDSMSSGKHVSTGRVGDKSPTDDTAVGVIGILFLFAYLLWMLWYVLESWFGPFRWWPW